jgi:hypothetical protein
MGQGKNKSSASRLARFLIFPANPSMLEFARVLSEKFDTLGEFWSKHSTPEI